jgi:peptidyl-prolyl cis-trans isomerase B (cyclophilin B)
MQNPVATIEMEDGGKIVVELYPEKAPNTVNNFIALANSGFYNGVIFHRVIPGFMIQGGDPDGVGTGGPGYAIKGEFSANGFKQNDISHARGVISMARSRSMDSAGSQFFIMVAPAPHLNGQYAAFGMATNGMETADKIVNEKRDRMDKPNKEQKIKQVTIETFVVDYPAPSKV